MITATPADAGHGPVVTVSAPAGLVFLSGVTPDLAERERPLPTAIADQLRLTLDNLHQMLAVRGLGWDAVAKVICYLTDVREATEWERAVSARFGDSWRPALTVVQVDNLAHRGARVTLDVVAGG